MMDWRQLLSAYRYRPEQPAPPPGEVPRASDDVRSPFQKDADRVIYAAPFRRLQDKTQVHATTVSDYVRTRLTHSLEVSSVGRSLGRAVGAHLQRGGDLTGNAVSPGDIGEIVAAACLAHDIGNPPFGHAGEDAIRQWFAQHAASLLEGRTTGRQAADLMRFDGNAQGFRILTRLTGWRESGGLQLTAATLAAMVKYPHDSLVGRGPEGKFGAFDADLPALAWVARTTGLTPARASPSWARHPLNVLVEAADDICYLVVDIEDGFKLRDIPFGRAEQLLRAVAGSELHRYGLIEAEEDRLAYLRAKAIGELCRRAVARFIDCEARVLSGDFAGNLLDGIEGAAAVADIRRYCSETLFLSRAKAEAELAGTRVLHGLLELFAGAVETLETAGWELVAVAPVQHRVLNLMPAEVVKEMRGQDRYGWLLRVTDYVSGMTDRYALALHRRLQGLD